MTPGGVVGGHVLVRELGRGGMGVVWLARHAATGAERAVKVVEVAGDPELALRFVREAEALARADGHPNVVRVFAAGREGARLHLVMELVLGGDLGRRLAGEGPPPVERAVEWALALCGAVAHLHARGVLHRDLKPQNVLLDGETPKLADFGLARLAGADALTRTGSFAGSPEYMAPEQAEGGAVDERTDVYGLGGVLYALLCGRPPFGGDGAAAARTIAALLTRPPVPPSRVRPGVPAALEAVCLRCLEKDPGARYARAADLARDLERWRRGELAAPRRRAGALAVAAGGVSVAALLGFAAWSARRTPVEVAAVVTASRPVRPPPDPVERARADCQRLVAGAFEAEPSQLRRQLTALAAPLDSSAVAALATAKAEALAALTAARGEELARRLADASRARATLEALAAVTRSAPAVGLPAPVEELLTRELLARLSRLDPEDPRQVDALVDFELCRARALDHRRRPPDELGRRIGQAFDARRTDYPLALLRVCMWADYYGLVGNLLSPRDALRAVTPDALRQASLLEPESQALALVRLEELLRRTDRNSAEVSDLATWREATADGDLVLTTPSDLGERWVELARRLVTKLSYRRLRDHRHEAPERDGLIERTVREGRLVVAAARRRIDSGLVLRQELSDLREATEAVADALRLGGDRPGALAALEDALAVCRPLFHAEGVEDGALDQAHQVFRNGVLLRTHMKDAGVVELARESLALSPRPKDRRDALVDLAFAYLGVPALQAGLPTVDAECFGALASFDARIAPLEEGEGGGMLFAEAAIRSALALGDPALARARAAIAIARYPDRRQSYEVLLPPAEER